MFSLSKWWQIFYLYFCMQKLWHAKICLANQSSLQYQVIRSVSMRRFRDNKLARLYCWLKMLYRWVRCSLMLWLVCWRLESRHLVSKFLLLGLIPLISLVLSCPYMQRMGYLVFMPTWNGVYTCSQNAATSVSSPPVDWLGLRKSLQTYIYFGHHFLIFR